MIIQVTKTVTEQKEINFPYVTFYDYINYYYYNNAENSCIIITPNGVEIRSCNCGLEYPEVRKEEAFKLMDSTISRIIEALNK